MITVKTEIKTINKMRKTYYTFIDAAIIYVEQSDKEHDPPLLLIGFGMGEGMCMAARALAQQYDVMSTNTMPLDFYLIDRKEG